MWQNIFTMPRKKKRNLKQKNIKIKKTKKKMHRIS